MYKQMLCQLVFLFFLSFFYKMSEVTVKTHVSLGEIVRVNSRLGNISKIFITYTIF